MPVGRGGVRGRRGREAGGVNKQARDARARLTGYPWDVLGRALMRHPLLVLRCVHNMNWERVDPHYKWVVKRCGLALSLAHDFTVWEGEKLRVAARIILGELVWRTAIGTYVRIVDMDDRHLLATIKMVQREKEKWAQRKPRAFDCLVAEAERRGLALWASAALLKGT